MKTFQDADIVGRPQIEVVPQHLALTDDASGRDRVDDISELPFDTSATGAPHAIAVGGVRTQAYPAEGLGDFGEPVGLLQVVSLGHHAVEPDQSRVRVDAGK